MSEEILKLRETEGACALLEGGLTRSSGWAFGEAPLLVRDPHAILVAGARVSTITTRGGTRTQSGDPLDVLRTFLHALSDLRDVVVVGALAYDYARPRASDEV